jgi:hypothetical protein
MKIKNIITVLLVAFTLNSCAPTNALILTATPIVTSKVTETLIPTVTVTPLSLTDTPTPQLLPVSTENNLPVFEINEFTVDHKYCTSPEVFLPIANAQGLNDDGIARKLMELWLDYFNTPQAPNYCRVDGYVIDKVYYDERTPSLPLEPKGDIMRVVLFSIKLIQYPTFWASQAGDVDKENWLHTGNNIAIFSSNSGYTMKFAYP